MEEYKPNSHKSKEEQKDLVPEKRVEKVRDAEVCRCIHFRRC